MQSKIKIMVIIILALSITMLNVDFLYAKERVDIFDMMLSQDNIVVTEYSVTATFASDEVNTEVCKDIFDRVRANLGDMEYTNSSKGEFSSIEFADSIYTGIITATPYNEQYIVTITISKKDTNNKTKELQGKLSEILSHVNSRISYSQCIKGKILNNTLDEVNKFVIDTLKKNKAENINTAKLYNGYSTISNTKLYDSKNIGGKDIDFSCAVVKYSSGCYLIMGTPEITLAY